MVDKALSIFCKVQLVSMIYIYIYIYITIRSNVLRSERAKWDDAVHKCVLTECCNAIVCGMSHKMEVSCYKFIHAKVRHKIKVSCYKFIQDVIYYDMSWYEDMISMGIRYDG